MAPPMEIGRIDSDDGLTQSNSDSADSDSAPLADNLHRPLLRATTEILRALSELPDERGENELVAGGVSTEPGSTGPAVAAATEHLIEAVWALSAAYVDLKAAGLPGGGVSPWRRG